MMRLAIDTAGAACAVALFDGDTLVESRHEVIGRGHAERLMPLMRELRELRSRPPISSVTVTVGPGSFTGIRVGLAAARALGLAWRAPVHGASSTALAAAAAFARDPSLHRVCIALDALRGELFVQTFERTDNGFHPLSHPKILMPDNLPAEARQFDAFARSSSDHSLAPDDLSNSGREAPDLECVFQIPRDLRRLSPSPAYLRPPDARPLACR